MKMNVSHDVCIQTHIENVDLVDICKYYLEGLILTPIGGLGIIGNLVNQFLMPG